MLVSSVAAALGLHMYKISSVDIVASSYSQVESKLRGLLFKIKLVAPCVFVIDNFEVSFFLSENIKFMLNSYKKVLNIYQKKL